MKFEVKLYYSGFVTHTIEADSDVEAINKARAVQDRLYHKEEEFIDAHKEVIETLQPWPIADTAEEV